MSDDEIQKILVAQARYDEMWRNQADLNKTHTEKIKDLFILFNALKTRVMTYVGGFVAIGSVIGLVIWFIDKNQAG